MYPGLNTLTRMSRPLRSTIQVRANERTAAFDALYTEQAAKPLIDTIEPVRITEEPLVSNGSAFCTVNKQAAHVRVERPVEMLLGDLAECGEFVNPGIDRQHVDMPGLRLDGCVDAVEVGKVGHIALDRCGIAADRGDCLIQLGLTAAGNKYSSAFFCEVLGDAEADAGAAAGHERDFASELPVMVISFPIRPRWPELLCGPGRHVL